jgi:hypothetical protein
LKEAFWPTTPPLRIFYSRKDPPRPVRIRQAGITLSRIRLGGLCACPAVLLGPSLLCETYFFLFSSRKAAKKSNRSFVTRFLPLASKTSCYLILTTCYFPNVECPTPIEECRIWKTSLPTAGRFLESKSLLSPKST